MEEHLSPKHALIEGEFGKEDATFSPTACESQRKEFKRKVRKELNETEESRAVGLWDQRNFISCSRTREYLSPKRVTVEGTFGTEEVVFFPTICGSLPEEFEEKARRELNETEESRRAGLKEMRNFILKEKLPFVTDDNFLLMFLRCQKFDARKTKEKLKRYNLVYRLLMDYVEDLDMEKLREMLASHMVGCFPYRDRNGCAIVYGIGSFADFDYITQKEWTGCLFALILFANSFPISSVCGLSFISEWSLKKLRHMYLGAVNFRKHLPHINALPVRFHRIDVIKEISLIHYLYRAVHPFIPTKIKDRVNFHGKNVDCFKRIYPLTILPSEFGGSFGPLDNSSYKEEFVEYLLKLKSMKCFESEADGFS